jgi:hypothetical protein
VFTETREHLGARKHRNGHGGNIQLLVKNAIVLYVMQDNSLGVYQNFRNIFVLAPDENA